MSGRRYNFSFFQQEILRMKELSSDVKAFIEQWKVFGKNGKPRREGDPVSVI